MSEGSAARIDPRFDARFQRGYVPDESVSHPESSSAPAPYAVAAASADRGEEPRAAENTATAHPESVPPAAMRAISTPPGIRHSTYVATETDRAHAGGAELMEMLVGAGAGADERAASAGDPWFLGAWTVSIVALVVGATLAMTGMMTETYTGGPSSQGDRWLQVVGWTVAPSMVQGGILGIVVMLVWTGLRHVRRAAVEEGEPA